MVEAGITAAMLMRFAESRRFGVHVSWVQTKITSYTPGPHAHKSICLYVWGDHRFMVDDAHTKSAIAPSKAVKPHLRPSVVTKVIVKCEDLPSNEWLEWAGELSPGHF